MIFTYCDSLEIKDDILNAFAKDAKTEKDIDTVLYLFKKSFPRNRSGKYFQMHNV